VTNLWPSGFEENTLPSAKSVLEEQAKSLSELTRGVVYAEIAELNDMERIAVIESNEFCFAFYLRGKFLEGYRFRVLAFSHDITLYPVAFTFDALIAGELGLRKANYRQHAKADSPAELEELLRKVLNSQRVKNVVGSIMRLSK
jgi:hypothetical protein